MPSLFPARYCPPRYVGAGRRRQGRGRSMLPAPLLFLHPRAPVTTCALQVLGVIEEVFSKEATEQLAALEAQAAAQAAQAADASEQKVADAGRAAAAAAAPAPAESPAGAGEAQQAQQPAGRQRGRGAGAAARRAEEEVAAIQAAMADQAGEAVASDFVQVGCLFCSLPGCCSAGCGPPEDDGCPEHGRPRALPLCPALLPAPARPTHPAHPCCLRCAAPPVCCASLLACRAGQTPPRWRPWRRVARRRQPRCLPCLLRPPRPPSLRNLRQASRRPSFACGVRRCCDT